jgi:N-acetylmuramoyl-L-alanine amidase
LKKNVTFLLSILLLLTLVFGTSLPVGANSVKTATVDVSILNVRSGPGLQHTRTSQVTRGQILPVLGEQPGWVQVSLSSGGSGWVSANYVTIKTTASVVQQPSLQAKITVSVLNVRSGPGTSYSRLTTITAGTVVPVIKQQGNWLQVRLASGQTGWITGQYTQVTQVASSGGQAPVSNTPAAPAPVKPETVAKVNVSALIVRSGPGTTYERIAIVSENTIMNILKEQGDWLQVRLQTGETGWVFKEYTTLTQNAAPTPLTPQTPSQTTPSPLPSVQQKLATVTVSALNARSAPNTDASRIALLPMGATVQVLSEQGDWLQVRLLTGETAWIAGWLVSVSTRDVTPSPGGSVTDDVYRPSGPSSVTGKIIVIDPGHGGTNPGAIGVTGLYEKEVVFDVSLRVAEKLRQAGANVVMTRDNDSTVFLATRVAIAEAANAHAFVSIHANAHPNRDVSGTESYYYRGRVNDMESYYLAAHLQNEMVKAFGLRDIGVKHGNFHVIRETTVPASLVELAFLSNHYDESLMKTNKFREDAAEAIFRGLERFFQF